MTLTLPMLKQMSPCDTNIFDEGIGTTEDARKRGPDTCPNYPTCSKDTNVACTLRFGTDVAKYAAEGTLEAELTELGGSGLLEGREFLASRDRIGFTKVRGGDEVLKEVKHVAQYLLDRLR